jgi:hypothetical protein
MQAMKQVQELNHPLLETIIKSKPRQILHKPAIKAKSGKGQRTMN